MRNSQQQRGEHSFFLNLVNLTKNKKDQGQGPV